MKFELKAEVRDRSGKGVARQLRRNGLVPGVLYGQGDCMMLKLDPTPLIKMLRSPAGSTALISLSIEGESRKNSVTALLRDYQVDPVEGNLLHVDLFEVSMTKTIRVNVPIHVVGGTPAGVKEGGVLHHNLRELEVECLPGSIPDAINVDASQLMIGHGIHVNELQVPEGVKLLEEGDQMVVSVAAPMSEEKLEALLTSGAVAEEGEGPEVIGKEKEKEAPETAEKGAAAPAAEAKGEKKEVKEGKEVKEEKKK